MKKTLLEIVQDILSDMDSEEVTTISDSVEALQVARIVESTYNNITATRDIPEHEELLKLTAASDSNYPTHFQYGDSVKSLTNVWYEDSEGKYREVKWCDPLEFLSLTDGVTEDYQIVYDKNGGTKLRIKNTKQPTFYTSFDDNWVVMNSFESDVDTTLQSSKVRAFGVVHPEFSLTDEYVPDIDATMFPYLIAEAKSTAMSLLKGSSDPKVEQAARRHKSYVQNDMYKTKRGNTRVNYGRR